MATLVVAFSGASAASPCSGSQTTSADGTTVYGSPCADRLIVTSPKVRKVFAGAGDDVVNANPNVELISGGDGDDLIYGELPPEVGTAGASRAFGKHARPALATISTNCEASCYLGDGSQTFEGGTGKDKIFGQRGNDTIFGRANNDALYGGVGDDSVYGNEGDDLVSGGLGTETVDGNDGSDLVRGDGTVDVIKDTGGSGTDTLSYSTGVTPGLHWGVGIANFPADSDSEERGVDVRLDGSTCEGEYESCNNAAKNGGGLDNVEFFNFENLIGTPFADVLYGSAGSNRIDGGGGADIIYGKGGNDVIYGGPDGDFISGDGETDTANGQGGADNCIAETVNGCAGSASSVSQRDRSKISVGFMVTNLPGTLEWSQLFVTGSLGVDRIKAVYSLEGGTGYVTVTTEGESASFDIGADAASEGCTYEAAKVKCTLPRPLDSITAAGMAGDDTITFEGFPNTATPVLLGGAGADTLNSNNGTEDILVDNGGNDTLRSGNYDDALLNNDGVDLLEAGGGNDLLISVRNCEGDTLDGAKASEDDGTAVNSASWAQLESGQVFADLQLGKAGDAAGINCGGGASLRATLLRIDDLEGSSGNDELYGDAAKNNLLGRLGKDGIWGRSGVDRIEAADGIAEVGGGGEGADSCDLDAIDNFASC